MLAAFLHTYAQDICVKQQALFLATEPQKREKHCQFLAFWETFGVNLKDRVKHVLD